MGKLCEVRPVVEVFVEDLERFVIQWSMASQRMSGLICYRMM